MNQIVLIILGIGLSGRVMAATPLESEPLILYGGASLFVPTGSHGIVRTGEAGLSVFLDEYRSLGLRLSVSVDPVAAPTGPAAEYPWASVLEYRRQMGIGYQIDPYILAAAGFVAADRVGDSLTNLVLPYAQLALGLRIVLGSQRATVPFFISPQTGVVPGVIYREGLFTVVAPVTSVHMGILIP